jgi:hypothetical protein
VIALVIATASLFCALAHPYRFFPSDDALYLRRLGAPGATALFVLSQRPNPTFWLYLVACARLRALVGLAPHDVFLVNALVANVVIALTLSRITRRATGGDGWALAAPLIFLTSAWTNTYYYLFSYTPMPTALLVVAASLTLDAARDPSKVTAADRVRSVASGALLALAFWASPSAAPMAGLLMLTCVALHLPAHARRGFTLLVWQTAGFALAFAPFASISFEAWLDHVVVNIHTSHYDDAIVRFGVVPRHPNFTFVRVFFEHTSLQASLAFAVMAALLGAALVGLRRRAPTAVSDTPYLTETRLGVTLVGLCAMHAAAIDLLPTTKLGRAHFHAFPFVVLVLSVGARAVLSLRGDRRAMTTAYALALALSATLSMAGVAETRRVRFSVPAWIAHESEGRALYVLREDPHAGALAAWLSASHITETSTDALRERIDADRNRGAHGALLVGPTGPMSGHSVLRHGTMPDFIPHLDVTGLTRAVALPYYSAHPAFLMEEEISSALFFSGRTQRPTTRGAGVTVFVW